MIVQLNPNLGKLFICYLRRQRLQMRNSSTINSNGNGLLQLLLMAEEFIELI